MSRLELEEDRETVRYGGWSSRGTGVEDEDEGENEREEVAIFILSHLENRQSEPLLCIDDCIITTLRMLGFDWNHSLDLQQSC